MLRLLRAVLIAAIIILGLSYASVGAIRVLTYWQMIDFASYYSAASLALDGVAIYDDAARETVRLQLGLSELPPYVYPPLLAAVLKPLALLPYDSARIIWLAASVVAFLASLVLLARTFRLSRRRSLVLVAAGLFLPGTWLTLLLGQVNMFLLLLIVLALCLNKAKEKRGVGIVLALAALVKLFPVLLIACFALKKRLAVVSWSALTGAVLGGFGILALGMDNHISFFTRGAITVAKMPPGMPYDQSTNAYFARLFVQTAYTSPIVENSQLANLLGTVTSALIVAVAAIVIARGRSDLSSTEYSLAVITMLLVSAKSWDHYGVFLLVPLAGVISQSNFHGPRATPVEVASLFAYALLLAQGFWTVLPRSVWLNSFGFYAMLILWACFIWMSFSAQFDTALAGSSAPRLSLIRKLAQAATKPSIEAMRKAQK